MRMINESGNTANQEEQQMLRISAQQARSNIEYMSNQDLNVDLSVSTVMLLQIAARVDSVETSSCRQYRRTDIAGTTSAVTTVT